MLRFIIASLLVLSSYSTLESKPNQSTVIKDSKPVTAARLLKWYQIYSGDDSKYTVESKEVAKEMLDHYLYENTKLWIDTFAPIGVEHFKWDGLSIEDAIPKGVSEERFLSKIKKRLAEYSPKTEKGKFSLFILDLVNKGI